MKISEGILKFFDSEDVQDALAVNDMQKVYEIAESWSAHRSFIRELTSILIQASVDPLQGMTEIPEDFLSGQDDITEFNIPKGIKVIGDSAFAYTNLERITISDSVKEIGDRAFAYCEGLKSVNLPAGIQLSTWVFLHSGLESIELKDVKLHGPSIFSRCSQLKSAVIKGDTPIIPRSVFTNCVNLTHVELPVSLKEIGANSFSNCIKLKEINFEGTTSQWRDVEIDSPNARPFSCKIICSDGVLRYDGITREWA